MKNKAVLGKYVNGSTDVIGEYDYNFGLIDKNSPGNYRFSVNYNMEKIDISLQKDPSLEQVQLFHIENYEIHRGCVGIAKKGKVDADITYYQTKDVLIHYEKER